MVDLISNIEKQTYSIEKIREHNLCPVKSENLLTASVSCLSAIPTNNSQHKSHSFLENNELNNKISTTLQPENRIPNWKSSAVVLSETPKSNLNSRFRSQLDLSTNSETPVMSKFASQMPLGFSRSESFNKNSERHNSFGSPRRRLTVDFNVNNGHYHLLSEGASKSTVQRLVDTFENENRRHVKEFQKINNELQRKLDASTIEVDRLRSSLRRTNDELDKQTFQIKNLTDIIRRQENDNRRIDKMALDLKFRDTELLKNLNELNVLRQKYDSERRKVDDLKNNMGAEIGRLLREKSHAEAIFRENVTLKSEIAVKEELLKKVMTSSTIVNDQPPNERSSGHTSNSLSNSELVSGVDNTIWQSISDFSVRDNDIENLISQLSERIEELELKNRELTEHQSGSQICGVCMDNKREVIFMPCLHYTCCKSCAEAMDQCSICRLRIMGKIEFFQ